MTAKLNANQARALATFAAEARPNWHPSATATALHAIRDRGPAFAARLIAAAIEDPECETPAALTWQDRAWWAAAERATGPEATDPMRAATERHHRLAAQRAQELRDRAPRHVVAAAIARLRAGVAPSTPEGWMVAAAAAEHQEQSPSGQPGPLKTDINKESKGAMKIIETTNCACGKPLAARVAIDPGDTLAELAATTGAPQDEAIICWPHGICRSKQTEREPERGDA